MTGIQKISSIILYVLGGLSIIFAGFYYLGGSVPGTEGTPLEEKNFTALVLVWAVILFLVATIATLIFSIKNIFSSPKAIKSFLLALGVGVVLLAVSFLLASSEALSSDILNVDIDKMPSSATIKWVGTGLNATYILAIVAFVGIIASEVTRAFK